VASAIRRNFIVHVAVLIVESFIAYGWFLETKGKALEEIAVIFDGDSVDVTGDIYQVQSLR
jgi:hypothetical protein